MAKHGAEIVFRQLTERFWSGRLPNGKAIDRTTGQPAHNNIGAALYHCYIHERSRANGSVLYELTTQGRDTGGRRYRFFNTLTEAQEAAIAWARRRFYVED